MGKRKKRVYIAGPMKGKPSHNVEQFAIADAYLKSEGYDTANPVEIGDVFGPPEAIERNPTLLNAVITRELIELMDCDAIYLLRGWENSAGARRELLHALTIGLEIIVQ